MSKEKMQLNSLIFEGTIISMPTQQEGGFVSVYIRNEKVCKDVTLYTDLKVNFKGMTGEKIMEYAKLGDRLRAIGTLCWDGMEHFMCSEHGEFPAVRSQGDEENDDVQSE